MKKADLVPKLLHRLAPLVLCLWRGAYGGESRGFLQPITLPLVELIAIDPADCPKPEMIASKRIVKGKCVKVNDADGIRIYHMPFPSFLRKPPKLNERGESHSDCQSSSSFQA